MFGWIFLCEGLLIVWDLSFNWILFIEVGYFFNGRELIFVIVIDMNEWFIDSVDLVIVVFSIFFIIFMDVIKMVEDVDNYD